MRDHALALRKKIVDFSQRSLANEHADEVIDFCEELFKFNFSSRCYRVKKPAQKQSKMSESPSDHVSCGSDICEEEDEEKGEKPLAKIEE